ncbi:MAG: UTRA domain-containing protein, partial [Methylophilaceae bacterium]
YKGSLYRMYEELYGIPMVGAHEEIRAVEAPAEVAAALKLKKGTPLLQIDRIAYSYGNRPLEWRLGLCLTDYYHYQADLE